MQDDDHNPVIQYKLIKKSFHLITQTKIPDINKYKRRRIKYK
jgi:hypothetical protein